MSFERAFFNRLVCFELLIELVAQGKKQATAKQVEDIAKGQNLRI
jgi:uncharacterized protein YhfF